MIADKDDDNDDDDDDDGMSISDIVSSCTCLRLSVI
jgi:hypothetical protein